MKYTISIFLFLCINNAYADSFFNRKDNGITIANRIITKKITISNGSVYAIELSLNTHNKNFINSSRDFSFTLNEQKYDGYSGWELVSTGAIADNASGKGIQLVVKSKGADFPIQLSVDYLLYPEFPIIRKRIGITNTGTQDIKLENINVADLNTRLSHVHSVFHHNYGRMKQIGHFVGNWDDPVVVVHNIRERRGNALGNEAPGVKKRTSLSHNQRQCRNRSDAP